MATDYPKGSDKGPNAPSLAGSLPLTLDLFLLVQIDYKVLNLIEYVFESAEPKAGRPGSDIVYSLKL